MTETIRVPPLDLETLFENRWLRAEQFLEYHVVSIASTTLTHTGSTASPQSTLAYFTPSSEVSQAPKPLLTEWKVDYEKNIPRETIFAFAYKNTHVFWNDENIEKVEFCGLRGEAGTMTIPVVNGQVLFRYHRPVNIFVRKYYRITTKKPTDIPPTLIFQTTPLYWFDDELRFGLVLDHLAGNYYVVETAVGPCVYSKTDPMWKEPSLETVGESLGCCVTLAKPPIHPDHRTLHVYWGACSNVSPLHGIRDLYQQGTVLGDAWLSSMPMQKYVTVKTTDIPRIEEHFRQYVLDHPEETENGWFQYTFETRTKENSDFQKQVSKQLQGELLKLKLEWYDLIKKSAGDLVVKMQFKHVKEKIRELNRVTVPYEPNDLFVSSIQKFLTQNQENTLT